MINPRINLVPDVQQFCLERNSDLIYRRTHSSFWLMSESMLYLPTSPQKLARINCKFSHRIRDLLKWFLWHFFESFNIYQICKELLWEKTQQNMQAWLFSFSVSWKKWSETQNGIPLLKSLALYTYYTLGRGARRCHIQNFTFPQAVTFFLF